MVLALVVAADGVAADGVAQEKKAPGVASPHGDLPVEGEFPRRWAT